MNNKSRIFFVVYSIAGMLALFFLPYHFPYKQILATSTSVDYGFNNQVGVIILFILSLGLVLYAWLVSVQDKNVAVKYGELISPKNDNVLDGIFKKCMSFQVIFCLFLWVLIRHTLGMNESAYFFRRLHDLIMGEKLYLKIDFSYGALLLYVPMLLYKFFSLFSTIKIQDAYSISLLFMQCLSFYWFYKIMSRIRIEACTKKIIFITLFIITLPLSTGMNYILFRFITPYAALFYLLYDKNMTPPLQYLAKLILFNSLIINISPEIGIVFSLTLFISFTVKALLYKTLLQFLYGLVSILSSAFWIIAIPGMLNVFLSFVAGGGNWPFVICYALIFFFLMVFFFAFHIGLQLKDWKNNINLMTVELMACGMIPAALGRCDPGHLIWNGLMMIIIIAAFLHNNIKFSRLFSIAVIIFILNCLPFSIRAIVIPNYTAAIKSVIKENNLVRKYVHTDSGKVFVSAAAKIFDMSEEKIFSKFSESTEPKEIPEILQNISDISMPLGGDGILYIYLGDLKKYHYLPNYTVGNVKEINRTLNALINEKPMYLLLPWGWQNYTNPSNPKSVTAVINILFIASFSAEPVCNSNEIYRETINYIKEAYEFVGEVQYSGIMYLYKLK